jgi:hypothetical protein
LPGNKKLLKWQKTSLEAATSGYRHDFLPLHGKLVNPALRDERQVAFE